MVSLIYVNESLCWLCLQLAADAGNAIAMTDDEKERLEDLLGDLGGLTDIPEEGATARSVSLPCAINTYR